MAGVGRGGVTGGANAAGTAAASFRSTAAAAAKEGPAPYDPRFSGIRDDDEAWFCVLRSIVSAVYLVGLLKLCTAYANMKQSWG